MTAPDKDELVIAAKTEAEFTALLRDILRRSGRTAGQVARFANLPRSTAYHFVSERNTSLPKDPDRVRAFAWACKLTADEVDKLLDLWVKLHQRSTGAIELAAGRDVVYDAELVHDTAADPIEHSVVNRLIGPHYPGEPGRVTFHGDVNIVSHYNHHVPDQGRETTGGSSHHQNEQDTGGSPPSDDPSALLRLAEKLHDRTWTLNAALLLTVVFALTAGLIMVLANNDAAASVATVTLVTAASVTFIMAIRRRR